MLQWLNRLLHRPAWEHNTKFFSAVSISCAAAPNLANARSDEFEHFVSHIVPIGVVKTFEVIHIQHGNSVIATQHFQPLVQCAPARQSCEVIQVGHRMGAAQAAPKQTQGCRSAHCHGDVLEMQQGEHQVEGTKSAY